MSKNIPLVSYLIPAYNAEAYIEACLDSVLKINLPKEIIVINDGSTDKTGEIINRYACEHDCIRAYHQNNVGEGASRNRLLSYALGKWVQFIDADDIALCDTDLSSLLTLADEQNVDVVKGLYQYVSEDDKAYTLSKKAVLDTVRAGGIGYAHGREFLARCFGIYYFHQNGCLLIRKETILRLGLQFDETQYLGPDILFYFELLASNVRLMEVPVMFYHWFQHTGSLSNPNVLDLKAVRSRITLLEKILAIAHTYDMRQSPYVNYAILSSRLHITSDYQCLHKANYSLKPEDDARLKAFSFSPEEFATARQHEQQIQLRQVNADYEPEFLGRFEEGSILSI